MCKYGCICENVVPGYLVSKRRQVASSIVKSLPCTCRHSNCAWITYALFMVFLFGKEKAGKNRKMLLFYMPNSVIRSLEKLETFCSNLFERQNDISEQTFGLNHYSRKM
jgi:hypothetical protein